LPHRIGGIEIYVHSLAKELLRLGHIVKLIVPEYPNEKSYPSSFEEISIITYPEFINRTRAEFRGTVPGKGLPGFIASVRAEKPDIVHFHQISNSNGMSIFHFAAVKKLGIPVVFTIHLQGWERSRLIKKVFEIADRIILLSDWYHEFLKKKYRIAEKVSVIKSGLPYFERNEIAERAESECLRLLYVGRVAPEKGLHILLKAIKKIDYKLVSLSIYGQISDEEFYKKCLLFCENKRNVEWHGFVKNTEIAKVISGYDFLVLPSIVQEMSPLVVLEAFSVGVPVIGSNSGGISEVVQDGVNGFLFEMSKSKSLKKVIEHILKNPGILKSPSFHFPPTRHFSEIAFEVQREYQLLLNS
jgi:glycosyltransferase involved in cell wall biosynthesis